MRPPFVGPLHRVSERAKQAEEACLELLPEANDHINSSTGYSRGCMLPYLSPHHLTVDLVTCSSATKAYDVKRLLYINERITNQKSTLAAFLGIQHSVRQFGLYVI